MISNLLLLSETLKLLEVYYFYYGSTNSNNILIWSQKGLGHHGLVQNFFWQFDYTFSIQNGHIALTRASPFFWFFSHDSTNFQEFSILN